MNFYLIRSGAWINAILDFEDDQDGVVYNACLPEIFDDDNYNWPF